MINKKYSKSLIFVSLIASAVSLFTAIITVFSQKGDIVYQIRNLLSSKNSVKIDTTAVIDTTTVFLQSDSVYFDVLNNFFPSGYMGDGEFENKYLLVYDGWRENPHSENTCIKVIYNPGPNLWVGLYWQNFPENWGAKPGLDLSKKGFKKISFWARGERGNERIEFKAGGIIATSEMYGDSFKASSGLVILTKEWKMYEISLEGKDLSNVIGGFGFVISINWNPYGATFYLADVFFN